MTVLVASGRLQPQAMVRGASVLQTPSRPVSVSVVIPNYNYARFLTSSIGSALGQRDVSVEVIVVDDASTDDSLEVASRFANSDDRVRVIKRPWNSGPVATFNAGIEQASGEYLVRLDADDMLTPGSLARACALAERYPGVGMVYGRPVHFYSEEGLSHRDDYSRNWVVWQGSEWLELRCAKGVNCITSPEVLMRTSVVQEVGGQRDLAHTHDLEMWLRLARSSDVGWVGADQAWHREHPASLSAREVDVHRDLEERAAAFRTLFQDGLGDPEQDARMLAVALSALANEALTRTTQAYAAGRGGTEETERYLAYASSLRCELDDLPRARALRTAQRLGPRRSRVSPYLLALAVAHRGELVARRARWRMTGL